MTTEAEIINQSITAQRETEYQEKRQKLAQIELDRWISHVKPVADILRERNHKVDLVVGTIRGSALVVDGVSCGWLIEIKEEYTTSTWRSRPTGKIRLTVGEYGNRTSYKQRNDGTFSYDKISDKIEAYVRSKKSEEDSQSRRNANKAIIDDFRKLANVTEYGWFSGSDNLEKPIKVSINIKRDLTVDEAFKLVEALKAAGIKPY